MKIAKMTPIFKSGKTVLTNFGPVSVLSCSKFLEPFTYN